ncbi:3-galactosyl-N-acetylglucosaminide 4-alpha-L-fucosyltransferase FUT3-like isoform 2-T2 [Liasis olivaceus]
MTEPPASARPPAGPALRLASPRPRGSTSPSVLGRLATALPPRPPVSLRGLRVPRPLSAASPPEPRLCPPDAEQSSYGCSMKSQRWANPTVCWKFLIFVLLQVGIGLILFTYIRSFSKPLKEDEKPLNLTILLWTWPYGIHVPFENCTEVLGVSNCHFTVDRRWYQRADAVLVHHYDVYLDVKKLPQDPRPPFQRWIWYSPEPPSKHPVPAFMDNLFNLTMSYRRDSDIFAPYGWLEVYAQPQEVIIPPKSKLVAWAVSNWKSDSVQVRVRYYEELKKYLQVDVYGRRHWPLPPNKLLSTLSQYKFYLAFENSQHEDYITEKVWRNAFLSGAVPVVLGPPRKNYERCLPPDSFIHIDDFPTVRELAMFLLELDVDEKRYQSYFRWRAWLKPVEYKSWGFQFCKACRALQARPAMYQTLPELSKWFQ